MPKATLAFAALALLLLLPPLANAHPPLADPQNSCVLPIGGGAPPVPTQLVIGTLSYFAPLGTSMPGCLAPPPAPPLPPGLPPYAMEWGSHATPCPPPPFVGTLLGSGVFCGPMVPPFALGTCTWLPVLNTVPTGLVIGFDVNLDGIISFPPAGPELYVSQPFPPGSWGLPNLYGVPARVMAYPTNLIPMGAPAPLDINQVGC